MNTMTIKVDPKRPVEALEFLGFQLHLVHDIISYQGEAEDMSEYGKAGFADLLWTLTRALEEATEATRALICPAEHWVPSVAPAPIAAPQLTEPKAVRTRGARRAA